MIIFTSLCQYRTWMMDVRNKAVPESRTGTIRASTTEDGGIALSIKTPDNEDWTRISLDFEEAEELIDGLMKVLGEKEAME